MYIGYYSVYVDYDGANTKYICEREIHCMYLEQIV